MRSLNSKLSPSNLFFYLSVEFRITQKVQLMNLKSIFTYYSHSIVAGGLDVISYTIRLICCTSFTIRREIVSNTS